ncbi:hypothetical protein ACTFIY_011855 [Dictyostelium cf. discoideum]
MKISGQWAFQQWSNGLIIKEEFAEIKKPPSLQSLEPSSDIKSNLESIIKGIQTNKILEVFDKYYHQDIIIFEKGDSTNHVGKAANRKAEESFVNNSTIHESKLLKLLVDANNISAYSQQWSNGLVIKEEFY